MVVLRVRYNTSVKRELTRTRTNDAISIYALIKAFHDMVKKTPSTHLRNRLTNHMLIKCIG